MANSSEKISTPLNETQLMLLRLFSRPMDDAEMNGLKNILLDYYDTLLQKELSEVIAAKGITRTDFETLLAQDKRTR